MSVSISLYMHTVNQAADSTQELSEEQLVTPIERTRNWTWRHMWQKNLLLTTTATHLGWGKPAGGVQRYRDNEDGLSEGL